MNPESPGEGSSHDTDFAALWSSDGVTRSLAPTGTGLPTDLPFLFSSGQHLGGYLIVRPIGKGGMGQVYEAEETESGRRVAVKILSRGLGDDEERERFLREGQLAASLSHPHCVYVFGTSEVQGFPVIAMELAPAGTLKELVVPGTLMPPAKAVDAVLQVVAGLEAAAAIGILHRDIKPSNCFVDRDGRVMVGDFGLSMTTLARDEQTVALAGTILGTPGFASPEQLRGEALDLRSDIYSVGATLYYLLTGRAPFDDPNVVTMITRVTSEAAPSVAIARPDVPGRLAGVVARCLAKKPGDRYATYAALAAALEPFRSAATTRAPLGRRFLAGVVDTYISALPLIPFNMYVGVRLNPIESPLAMLTLSVPTLIASVLYYAISEGRWGCSVGKALFSLRVIDAGQSPPGIRRAAWRAALFLVPPQIITGAAGIVAVRWLTQPGGPASSAMSIAGLASTVLSFVCLAIQFSTIRRANGYSAIHDLLSRTRVVLRLRPVEARETSRRERAAAALPSSGARIGPYVVTDAVKASAAHVSAPTIVDGYDDRLHRGVWIELLPPGTPAVPAWRRDLGRPARARWISGRRTADECWDAYEAFDGRPLLHAVASPQPWSRVRHWTADLAQEIAAATEDGSLPALHDDRVWITNDDRARLLDFTPPSTSFAPRAPDADARSSDAAAMQPFLYGIAAGALRGVTPETARQHRPSTPLPLPARDLLLALSRGTLSTAKDAAERAAAMLREPAVFPKRRRLAQLGACSVIPFVMAVAVFTVLLVRTRAQTTDPESYKLNACVQRLVALEKKGEARLTQKERDERAAIEVYIAEHLRGAAEEKAAYARTFPAVTSVQREYRLAEHAIASHPQRSTAEIQHADEVAARVIEGQNRGLAQVTRPVTLWIVVAMIGGGAALCVAILGLIGALVARGGFTLRSFGAALVIKDGRNASRTRAVFRAIVAWSPLALWLLIVKYGPKLETASTGVALLYTLVLALLIAGAVWAWLHPSRGIQDRIAGTWIVPR
jgi:eukaryotic-like serine/threonine-protein kinase